MGVIIGGHSWWSVKNNVGNDTLLTSNLIYRKLEALGNIRINDSLFYLLMFGHGVVRE